MSTLQFPHMVRLEAVVPICGATPGLLLFCERPFNWIMDMLRYRTVKDHEPRSTS
jgi:hypothetical protein